MHYTLQYKDGFGGNSTIRGELKQGYAVLCDLESITKPSPYPVFAAFTHWRTLLEFWTTEWNCPEIHGR